MNIESQVDGATTTLKPIGRIDAFTSSHLQTALDDLLRKNVRQIVIDLSEVPLVTSAGLRVLIYTAKQLLSGGKLVLCGLNTSVADVVHVAGFDNFLTICPDREAALAKVCA